jgi:hypothetical protein
MIISLRHIQIFFRLLRTIPAVMAVLIPAVILGQTGDPGSKDPGTPNHSDSIPSKGRSADSTHHTDTVRYHYMASSTGTLNNTNSFTSYVWNNAFKASMARKSATVNVGGTYIYGRQGTLLTNKDFSTTADVDLYKTLRHFYYWGLVTYNTSISLLINHQLQTGLGPGYNLLDKKKAVVILSDGILFEKGDLYDSLYGGPNGNVFQRDRYQAVRNSFRLLYHFVLQDRYTLDGTGFLQNAVNHWPDYILKLNASISVKLYKWLAFSVTGVYNKFTRTRTQSTLLTFGLTVQQ